VISFSHIFNSKNLGLVKVAIYREAVASNLMTRRYSAKTVHSEALICIVWFKHLTHIPYGSFVLVLVRAYKMQTARHFVVSVAGSVVNCACECDSPAGAEVVNKRRYISKSFLDKR
jgi:hypothetical protein